MLACSTANTEGSASNNNIAQTFIDKGVKTVVAFEENITSAYSGTRLLTTQGAGYWGKIFVQELGNGKTVENAKNMAFDKLVENQCDIFDITEEEYHTKCEDDIEYVNRRIHCGMDTCVILGQNQTVKH